MKSNEQGFTTVLMCMLIIVVMAMAGLLIDGGMAMNKKWALDHATKVAVLKAVEESYDEAIYNAENRYVLQEDVVKEKMATFLALNMEEAEVSVVIIRLGEEDTAYVQTKVDYETCFMRLFGVESVTLKENMKGYIYD